MRPRKEFIKTKDKTIGVLRESNYTRVAWNCGTDKTGSSKSPFLSI